MDCSIINLYKLTAGEALTSVRPGFSPAPDDPDADHAPAAAQTGRSVRDTEQHYYDSVNGWTILAENSGLSEKPAAAALHMIIHEMFIADSAVRTCMSSH